MAVVVVGRIVGMEMVVAVQPHPIDRAVLAAEGAAGGDQRLQPAGHREGAMGQEAVVAERDPHTGGEPIEHQQRADRLPAPEAGQQRHQGEGVNHHHEHGGAPAAPLAAGAHADAAPQRRHAPGGRHAATSIGCRNWRSSRLAKRSFSPSWCTGCPWLALIRRKVSTS